MVKRQAIIQRGNSADYLAARDLYMDRALLSAKLPGALVYSFGIFGHLKSAYLN